MFQLITVGAGRNGFSPRRITLHNLNRLTSVIIFTSSGFLVCSVSAVLPMENVHLTPLKSDPDVHSAIDAGKVLSFSTPNSSSCPAGSGADDGAGIDSLSGSFTGMKLNAHIADGGGALKRSVDRFTVEGSPMVPLPFKQPNLNHTPLAFAQAHHSSTEDTSGILENDAYSHCIDRLSPILETVEAQVSTGKQGTSRKVLVICSASNEHNTGDHQENMLRTALLCGEDGCLRRPELSSSIDWINSDTIQPASLCDLLRYLVFFSIDFSH